MGATAIREFLVSELTATPPDVPMADGIDLQALTEGDNDPMFVTLPIMRVGKSRNGRYYDEAFIKEIAVQVNENRVGGILGHVPDSERDSRYELPQVLWVGAKVNGDTAYGKGYIPPYADNMRKFLRAARATGHRVATSIYGSWPQIHDATIGATRVLAGGILENIDFAPPARAGMNLAAPVSLSAEMVGTGDGTNVKLENASFLAEMSDADREKLIKVITDAVMAEAKDRDPGTTVHVRLYGSHTVPDPGATNDSQSGPDMMGSPDATTGNQVRVSVETGADKWDDKGGTFMDRSEVLKTITVAELEQLPQAVRDHIANERARAVSSARDQWVTETVAPIVEALGAPADTTLPRLVSSVAELVTFRAETQRREATAAVESRLAELLAERVAKDSPTEIAERARRTVRRLVTAEMKEESVTEAERAVGAVLSDPDVTHMVDTLVRSAQPAVPAQAAGAAQTAPAAEMSSTTVPTIIAVNNGDKAEGRDRKQSAFRKVVIEGPAS